MTYLQTIEVKVYPVTNNCGTRVALIDHQLKEKVVLNYNYKFNSADDQAQSYLINKGLVIVGRSRLKNGNAIFLIESFHDLFNSIK